MTQPTLLLVDDSIDDLRVLVSMLRSAGYRLIVASNGRDGYNRAMAFKPDLILLDVRMPQMDGFSVCRVLKATPATAAIPVIFLTAANDVEDRLEGLRLGGVDYVSKPAMPEEVLLRVGIHLPQRQQQPDETDEMDNETSVVDTPLDPDDCLATAAIRLMEEDLSVTPQVDELAQKLGTNRRRLSEVFRERFGCTATAWLRERRMTLGRQWLVQTKMTVQQISEELGFSSPANFATAFRERFGLQPREYRMRVRRAAHNAAPGRAAIGEPGAQAHGTAVEAKP